MINFQLCRQIGRMKERFEKLMLEDRKKQEKLYEEKEELIVSPVLHPIVMNITVDRYCYNFSLCNLLEMMFTVKL